MIHARATPANGISPPRGAREFSVDKARHEYRELPRFSILPIGLA